MKKMFTKWFILLMILGIIWLAIIGSFAWALVYVINFPVKHPQRALELETRVISFFEQITLPIKLANLSRLEPDKELLMPVYGRRVSEIADTWGAPRGENGERKHEGQDIFAPRGTPIFSATTGYVTRITGDKIGGNSVYVTGTGGIDYYYTHLDRFPEGLPVGDKVTTDTVIGFVGNSGNAETTPFHLHFGVYVTPRQALDPLPLLINR